MSILSMLGGFAPYAFYQDRTKTPALMYHGTQIGAKYAI